MAVFPSFQPVYNSSETIKQEYITVQLGDGYQQRIVEGLPINKRLRTFSYKYELSKTDAATINTFLDARFDATMESFDFTPVNETTAIKVICTNRRSNAPFNNRVNLNLTFEQVAEP